jgi:hypothetical protein
MRISDIAFHLKKMYPGSIDSCWFGHLDSNKINKNQHIVVDYIL